ncbi:MAG: TraB/GumN family protein [Bacteroidales bacterium]|nr:TraB/GumN family protein [Bacteroidales bacterium]
MKSNILKSVIVLIAIFLLTYVVQPAYAQESGAIKHKKSLLWKITGNGLEQPSYLFGTVHIIDSANYFLEETVKEKFNKCEKIVFEVDMDDPQFQQKTIFVLMLKNDSLDNLLSKQDYEKVNEFYANKLKIPLEKVKKMKPYYLTSFVAILSLPKNIKSFEEEFMKTAKDQNKEILGISTVEKESEILVDRIPLNIQAQMLLDAIDDVEKYAEVTDKLKKSYLDSDIDRFYELTKDYINEYKIVFESMFPKRHEVWIPNMIKLMNNHSCFFAVGVGHLAGEDGLIELLKQEGYEVRPVNKDFKLQD